MIKPEYPPYEEERWLRFAPQMWKRSYEVALYAVKVLESRVMKLRSQHWDTPMQFFYPEEER